MSNVTLPNATLAHLEVIQQDTRCVSLPQRGRSAMDGSQNDKTLEMG